MPKRLELFCATPRCPRLTDLLRSPQIRTYFRFGKSPSSTSSANRMSDAHSRLCERIDAGLGNIEAFRYLFNTEHDHRFLSLRNSQVVGNRRQNKRTNCPTAL